MSGNIKFDRRHYWSSLYRRARRLHNCGACGEVITVGQTYLYFVPREREHIDVCLGCSVKKNSDRSHRWPCQAVRERLEKLGDKAGLQEHEQGSLGL